MKNNTLCKISTVAAMIGESNRVVRSLIDNGYFGEATLIPRKSRFGENERHVTVEQVHTFTKTYMRAGRQWVKKPD